MHKFEGNTDFTGSDKDQFANNVCKLLYQKYNGNLQNIYDSNELSVIYNQFDDHVRNIYEVIYRYIPLFYYYELKENESDKGCSNWDMSKSEYDETLKVTINECVKYYG